LLYWKMGEKNDDSLPSSSSLVVGNYCHDILTRDGVVLAESLGGAASFISAVLDGVSAESTFVAKVGSDFAYSVTHPPIVCPSARTTLFQAIFSSQDRRILKRLRACDAIAADDLPAARARFRFGLAVGVGGEILPETLEKMIEMCETVLVDVQALIRVFDPADGTVNLVPLADSGFHHLLPGIGFLKASSDEAPYIDIESVRKHCCVVVTNGEDGCTVHRADGEQRIVPFPTVQVDPTGAGDSFLGGLVVGLSRGLSVPDAALLGNFFGSLTVSQLGLPKFDSRLLQVVMEELEKKKKKKEKRDDDDELNNVCAADHAEFYAALGRAAGGSVPSPVLQECRWESAAEAAAPRAAEH
ncbi:hypothetical protein M569_12568, partial [Genlisea aurea]